MTTFDSLGCIELTLSAALMMAILSVVIGINTGQRLRISAALFAWFTLVVILGATRALHYEHPFGAPALGLAVIVPIVLMSLAVTRVKSLREGLDRAPLSLLVALHVIRVLGVNFLMLQATGRLPAPFAPSAGWGDIIAGLAAVPVALLVARRAKGWRASLIAWNLFGMADLIAAVTLGMLSSPGPLRLIFAEPGSGIMTLLPWLFIPGFLVPLFFTIHLGIFYRLASTARSSASPDAQSARSGKCGGFVGRWARSATH